MQLISNCVHKFIVSLKSNVAALRPVLSDQVTFVIITIGAIVVVICRSSFINKSLQLVNALLTLTSFWWFYLTEFQWRGTQTLFPRPNTKGKKRSGHARLLLEVIIKVEALIQSFYHLGTAWAVSHTSTSFISNLSSAPYSWKLC